MTSFFNYGDAGAIQAQVIQSLDSIPKSEFFELKKDPDQFNLWQKTILNDDIKDFHNHEIPPRSFNLSSDENFTQFELKLMGMTDVRKIYLQFKFKADFINITNNIQSVYQCAMGFLQGINRINIRLGEELHDINKEQLNNANFMYAFLSDSQLTNSEIKIIKNTIGNIAPIVNLKKTGTDGDYVVEDIVTQLHYANSPRKNFDIVLNIPLWLMHPFFMQRKTFLPTDLKMTIEIFYKPKFNLLMSPDTDQVYFEITSSEIIKLCYQIQIPKADIIALLNNKWQANKLMYNIMRYEYKDFPISSTVYPNTFEEIFSFTYRPLSIVLVPFKTIFGSNVSMKYPYNLPNTTKAVRGGFIPLPLKYNKIQVYQNGELIYDYISNYQRTANSAIEDNHQLYETVNNEYRLTGNELSKFEYYSDSCLNNKHAPYIITLDPSCYFNKNVFSSRTEKSNMRISINYDLKRSNDTSFGEQFFMRIYYSYVRQMTINPVKNIVEIDWPVISSSSAQSYIQNTFNTN